MNIKPLKSIKVNNIILFAFLLLLFCLNLFFNKNLGDDYGFSLVLTQESICEFTVRHFYNWSARNLIEIPLVIFTYLPIIFFQLANTALLFALTVFIVKMFCIKSPAVTAFVCLAVFSYSFFDFTSAGWVTTFICMFWAYAVGTICLSVPIKSIFFKQQSKLSVTLSCIGMVYACNLELVCAYLLIVNIGLILYSLIVNKKVCHVLFYHLCIIILGLIYTLVNPGNSARTAFTVASHYHDYPMNSILIKVQEGVYQALLSIFLDVNVYLLIFVVVLTFAVFVKYQNSVLAYFYRFLSVLMLFLVFFLNLSYNYLAVRNFFHNNANINTSNVNSIMPYLTFIVLCFLLMLILANVYIALGHNKNAFIALLLIIAGFASATALGLTAGISVSGARAYVSLKFSFILASVVVFKDMFPTLNKAQKMLLAFALAALGAFTLFIMIEGFGII